MSETFLHLPEPLLPSSIRRGRVNYTKYDHYCLFLFLRPPCWYYEKTAVLGLTHVGKSHWLIFATSSSSRYI